MTDGARGRRGASGRSMSPREIERPVLVVSAGRSGSSIFHRILTHHPDACWLPRGCDDDPGDMARFRPIFRAVDLPLLGRLLRRRYGPVEGYGFWDHHFPGFSRSFRDLRRDDVTPHARESIRSALAGLLTGQRDRLVLKVTGWPRVGFLAEVFPDARFVHIVRDGRSVAASLLRVPWWKGWEGPENWRFGPLTPEEAELWRGFDRSFVALAGIEWNRIMEAMERSRDLVPSRDWHTIRYEDLCRNPREEFERVLEFAELDASPTFLDSVEDFGLESRNPKWRKHLSPGQQAVLEEVVREQLDAHGYA